MRVAINCLQVDPRYVGGVTSYVFGLLEGFAEVSNGCQFRVFVSGANAQLFHDLRKHDLRKPDLRKPAGLDFVEVDDNLLGLKGNLCRAALLTGSAGVYKMASDSLFQKISGTHGERVGCSLHTNARAALF